MPPGKYKLQNFCLEPTSFQVKEEAPDGEEEFVPTTLLTRMTYSLVGMEGEAEINKDGSMRVREKEGMDYAATTVRARGDKEYTTFLFSIKDLEGKGSVDAFGGDFTVPSYRGATYMDPRVSALLKFAFVMSMPDSGIVRCCAFPLSPAAAFNSHSFVRKESDLHLSSRKSCGSVVHGRAVCRSCVCS